MARFVIGVDGGGTKTLGAISGEDGKIFAQTEVGSTNHHSNPIETVRGNLNDLVSSLLKSAGASAEDVACICLGMAGVDRPEDKPLITNMVHEFLPKAEVIPVNDGVIALVGGALKPFGIIVISGTGSIAFGINKQEQRARSGGWGHILGDEGSGYVIGLRGLRAVCRAHDGRAKSSTALRDIVLRHLGIERPEQILGWVKANQGSKAEIGALSRLVFEAHEQGDATATQILKEEAVELAEAARAVAENIFHGESGYQIVVGGGNLRKSQAYFDLFKAAVAERLPGINVIRPRREPVEGAVIYALQNIGITETALTAV
jgi:N-acetylglucosamine kinase-like BadF-type ATPase